MLDCLSVRDWSAITSESAAAIHLPSDTTRFLADPHLQVCVVEEKEQQGLRRKRVSVEITWANAARGTNEHVRLSTWVFARGPLNGAAR